MKKINLFVACATLAALWGAEAYASSSSAGADILDDQHPLARTLCQAYHQKTGRDAKQDLKKVAPAFGKPGEGIRISKTIAIGNKAKKGQIRPGCVALQSEWDVKEEQGGILGMGASLQTVKLDPALILERELPKDRREFKEAFPLGKVNSKGKVVDYSKGESFRISLALRYGALQAFLMPSLVDQTTKDMVVAWKLLEPVALQKHAIREFNVSLQVLAKKLPIFAEKFCKGTAVEDIGLGALEAITTADETQKFHFRVGLQGSETPDFEPSFRDHQEAFFKHAWIHLNAKGFSQAGSKTFAEAVAIFAGEEACKFRGGFLHYTGILTGLGFAEVNPGFMTISLTKWLAEGSSFYTDDSIYGFKAIFASLETS
tara:strand:- start:543 stop:1661 length:1119 start_codon:yes stop_codon:yes gene_type:complete